MRTHAREQFWLEMHFIAFTLNDTMDNLACSSCFPSSVLSAFIRISPRGLLNQAVKSFLHVAKLALKNAMLIINTSRV